MATLTTDHGTFQADTEKECLAMARKAKREAQKAEAQQHADYEQARLYADSAAYRVYRAIHRESESFPRAWELARPDSRWFPSCEHDYSSGKVSITLDTEHGRAIVDSYCWEPVGVVFNVAGWAMLLFVEDKCSKEHPISAYAVGVRNGVYALDDMPGVTMDQFREFQS
jgi:hypothetical protein